MKPESRLTVTLSAIFLVLLTACSIHQTKDNDKGDKKVEIKTPFVDMHVSTETDAKDTGMTPYPGARAKESQHDKNRVNLSFGGESFGVKVVAVTFLTDDPPAKVIEFYRKDLKKFGDVLECPKGISESHGKGEDKAIRCSDSGHAEDGKLDMAVGIPDRQHLVSVKPNGSGTEFALVYVNVKGHDDTL